MKSVRLISQEVQKPVRSKRSWPLTFKGGSDDAKKYCMVFGLYSVFDVDVRMWQ